MLRKTRWEAKSLWGGTKDLRTPSEVVAAPREGCVQNPLRRAPSPWRPREARPRPP